MQQTQAQAVPRLPAGCAFFSPTKNPRKEPLHSAALIHLFRLILGLENAHNPIPASAPFKAIDELQAGGFGCAPADLLRSRAVEQETLDKPADW